MMIGIIVVLYLLAMSVAARFIFLRWVAAGERAIASRERQLQDKQQQLLQLKEDWRNAEKVAQETFALYDMMQEISKHLTDEEALLAFKSKLRENIFFEDCRLLDPLSAELKALQAAGEWQVYPLRAKNRQLGFLVVKGVADNDREKVTILANQFALALQRISLYAEVERLAMTDSLTEIHTRRYVLQRLDEELLRAQARQAVLSLLMIDVDHFKAINDHYGHLTGDFVLKEIGRLIRENIREIDICGRYGGEEFCVVLPDTNEEGASFAAERIRLAIEKQKIQAYDALLQVTVSAGCSTFPLDGKELTDLVDRADWALYKAKKEGRNRVYSATVLKKKS